MYKYGTKSTAKLSTCHPFLVAIALEALELSPYDITILHGLRDMEFQNELVLQGKSHTLWPQSKHNSTKDPDFYNERFTLSDALDFAPYVHGINWDDTHIFAVIAGIMIACGAKHGIKLRWGGDWDTDGTSKDQTLMDWGHIELVWE